jgi:hypothetical protein
MADLARHIVLGWYDRTVDRGPDACRDALDAAVHARR